MKRGSRRGCFHLKRVIIGIDDEDDCTFTIRVENRVYHFQGEWCSIRAAMVTELLHSPAQDSEERERWVHALQSCIRRLLQPVRVSRSDTLPHSLCTSTSCSLAFRAEPARESQRTHSQPADR